MQVLLKNLLRAVRAAHSSAGRHSITRLVSSHIQQSRWESAIFSARLHISAALAIQGAAR